jgi:hypothetical protein
MIDRAAQLRHRLRWLTSLFILALVASGVTAIPLETELDWLARLFGIAHGEPPPNVVADWLGRVRTSLHDVNTHHPFLAYGTDWLAFGHVVIAIAFVGAWRDPVKNIWLFEFGMIACALVAPWAFVFGAVRGIPVWWRLIDCSFGVFGFLPLWYCRRFARELVSLSTGK